MAQLQGDTSQLWQDDTHLTLDTVRQDNLTVHLTTKEIFPVFPVYGYETF